jgi:SEC-C motif
MATQSAVELRRHLDEHFGFLATSSRLYDSGSVAEAKRLAVSIRVLVHDTQKSASLLMQLGMKTGMFLDTASERPQPELNTSYAGLVGVFLGSGASKYRPQLDSVSQQAVPFDQWWNAPVIIDFTQREITRRRLILAVANKDGGAHIDPELDDIYADLSRSNSMRRMYSSDGAWQPLIGVEHASVRQVAHEMLRTFHINYTPEPPQESGIVISGFRLGMSSDSSRVAMPKVGRNEPCPCESGKKYKKCHGA